MPKKLKLRRKPYQWKAQRIIDVICKELWKSKRKFEFIDLSELELAIMRILKKK